MTTRKATKAQKIAPAEETRVPFHRSEVAGLLAVSGPTLIRISHATGIREGTLRMLSEGAFLRVERETLEALARFFDIPSSYLVITPESDAAVVCDAERRALAVLGSRAAHPATT